MRRNVVSSERMPDGTPGFRYTLECGHFVDGKDFRRWRKGILTEPKSAHCDECKDKDHDPVS